MKFKPGHPKFGGRGKGVRAYKSQLFSEVLEENNFCPATAMIKLFQKAEKHADDKKKAPSIRAMFLKIAADMAKELACYAYPQLQSIAVEREDPLAGMTSQQKLEAMRDAVKLLEAQAPSNGEPSDGSASPQQPH